MGLLSWLKDRIDKKAAHYTYEFIEEQGSQPLRANEGYFRIWVGEMFLAKSKRWGTDEFPSVISSVRLKFADYPEVDLSHVAQAPQDALSNAVMVDQAATPLVPFRGGVVDVNGALVALKGGNQVRAVIGVLGDFAGMIAPPVGQALGIAGKVADGVEKVLTTGESDVHLGFRQGFADAGGGGHNALRPGYMVVILGTAQQLEKHRPLEMRQGRLVATRDGKKVPLDGFDYMVYRIEVRDTRDDWRFQNIEEPMNKAIDAFLMKKPEDAAAYERVALIAALTSDDLAVPDRRIVATAIRSEIEAIKALGVGAAPPARRNLAEVVAVHGMNVAEARDNPPLTLEELLAT